MVLDSVVPPSLNIVDKCWEAPASGLKALGIFTGENRDAGAPRPGAADSSDRKLVLRRVPCLGPRKVDPASPAPVVSTVPTLILTGTFNSSTAPSWVEQLTRD
ncbi:MAG: hypothetical protein QOI36_4697 [Pseudonocardiales bacterium]|nr:hypothetical protein [Pseudonocardiales bacterium]